MASDRSQAGGPLPPSRSQRAWIVGVGALAAAGALAWFLSSGAAGGAQPSDPRAPGTSVAKGPTAVFEDVAAAAGIHFRMPFLAKEQGEHFRINLYDHGSGVAVGDYDGDGRDDIYFCNQLGLERALPQRRERPVHRRHEGGGADLGLADRISVAAVFADYDDDGHQDLYVTTTRGGNVLFHGRGRRDLRGRDGEGGPDARGALPDRDLLRRGRRRLARPPRGEHGEVDDRRVRRARRGHWVGPRTFRARSAGARRSRTASTATAGTARSRTRRRPRGSPASAGPATPPSSTTTRTATSTSSSTNMFGREPPLRERRQGPLPRRRAGGARRDALRDDGREGLRLRRGRAPRPPARGHALRHVDDALVRRSRQIPQHRKLAGPLTLAPERGATCGGREVRPGVRRRSARRRVRQHALSRARGRPVRGGLGQGRRRDALAVGHRHGRLRRGRLRGLSSCRRAWATPSSTWARP